MFWLAALLALPAAADESTMALETLKARIASGELPDVHGLVVVVDGRTVAEWYFHGPDTTIGPTGPIALGDVTFTADTLHDVRSVTKSVVSMLFGIAHADGAVPNLDTPVLDYFPELADLRTPERLAITVRHALTMTTGLHWDEFTYPYTDRRNSEIAMEFAPDIYRHTLTQPIDVPPGTRFNYSGGDVALIGAIVARTTKTPLETFARQRLFEPLGIERFEWSKRLDTPRAASGLRLTPRDMAKLGELMRNGGVWNGVQVVPRDWVAEATTPHIPVEPDPECGMKYGYFWWLGAGCETQPRTPGFVGIGNGGQRLWVVPSRRLVVAMTAGLYDDPRQRDVPTAVLTAVLGGVPAH